MHNSWCNVPFNIYDSLTPLNTVIRICEFLKIEGQRNWASHNQQWYEIYYRQMWSLGVTRSGYSIISSKVNGTGITLQTIRARCSYAKRQMIREEKILFKKTSRKINTYLRRSFSNRQHKRSEKMERTYCIWI